MRPAEVVARAERYLAAHGVESPRRNAEVLLMTLLGTDRAGLYARSEGLDAATAKAYGRALCQRCTGTPLQHLTGEEGFRGVTLAVAPGVFLPRPETEVVVEAGLEVLRDVASPTVVDVGTGTGAIALALKQERPDGEVYGTDADPRAVDLARANARKNGLDVRVLGGDLLAPLPPSLRGGVDLVISNPPYVSREEYEGLPEEVKADPYDALLGGTEVHRRLLDEVPGWLRPGGWLVVEIGASQGEEVAGVFRDRLEDVEVLEDLASRPRVVRGRVAAPA